MMYITGVKMQMNWQEPLLDHETRINPLHRTTGKGGGHEARRKVKPSSPQEMPGSPGNNFLQKLQNML